MNPRLKPTFTLLPVHCTVLFSALALLFSGCASHTGSELLGGTDTSFSERSTETITYSSESEKMVHRDLEYKGVKLEHTSFDLPVEMNSQVEKWIAYFTGRGRKHFEAYLERSEYFIPFIRPILRNAKAPEDLVYLAMIESGFNNNARSHARAVGAWQFISATGRRYGLDVNWWVDERRDVEKSTIAAIQYLKELNAMFGSWHLAAAAYNAGEAKVKRAIKRYKTDDFWKLTKYRYLRPETKNYVPKLFAAAIVSKNRTHFGFQESYVSLKNVSAAMASVKAEEDNIERLPDNLDGDAVDEPSDAPSIELTKDSPVDAEEEGILEPDSVESILLSMSDQVRVPHVNKKGEVNGDILTEIEIPSPADLFRVASAAGLSYLEFKSMNSELLRWVTPPHHPTYKIRIPLSRKDQFIKKYFDSSFNKEVEFLVYKTRSNETPRKIAGRFGINYEPIVQMNQVSSKNSRFRKGALVTLPIPSDFVRSIASLKSLELLDPKPKKRYRSSRRYRRVSRSRRAKPSRTVHSTVKSKKKQI